MVPRVVGESNGRCGLEFTLPGGIWLIKWPLGHVPYCIPQNLIPQVTWNWTWGRSTGVYKYNRSRSTGAWVGP